MRPRLVACVGLLAAVLVACASSSGSSGGGGTGDLVAETAGYDLAVGPPARFIEGLLAPDQRSIAYGTVELRFCFVGAKKATQPCRLGRAYRASFLPIPGTSLSSPPSVPTALPPSKARGVYATDVAFDKAGFWEVEASARIDGKRRAGTSAFQVHEHHVVPGPGDQAQPTDNLTLASPGAPPAAIDSRAANGPIPDPELHQTTIAAALAAHRPVLVVFSTPVYCVSRFCGPITDMVQGLAHDYADRAAFIHVEIWRDFDQHQVNKAAADWVFKNDELNEPWVFLIGADGRITARWDNVATRGEVEPLLQRLPVLPKG